MIDYNKNPEIAKSHYEYIVPFIEEMKGQINVLVFDCKHPHAQN